MHKITTQIDIDGSIDDIWKIMDAFEEYPKWNPFIRSIKGDKKKGGKLEARLQPVGGKEMTIRPRVLDYSKTDGIRWIGRIGLPRIFDGTHSFSWSVQKDGMVRFVQQETFRGILVPFAKKMLDEKTKPGFEEMNRALKTRVEKR